MSTLRECNNITAHASTPLTKIRVSLNGHVEEAMIDSGAQGCFVSPRAVQRCGLATRTNRDNEEWIAIDGSIIKGVTKETLPVTMCVQQHQEEIVLNVFDMARHDVVLGLP